MYSGIEHLDGNTKGLTNIASHHDSLTEYIKKEKRFYSKKNLMVRRHFFNANNSYYNKSV